MKLQNTISYQNVLRAIGQGLETLDVNSFDLEVSDDHFVVCGEGKKHRAVDASKSKLKKSFLSLLLNVTKHRTAQTAGSQPFHFSGLTFTQRDIELLERKGQLLQTNLESGAPNPHRLSQILRTVGAYLDQDRCRLFKLSWHNGIFTLWHINRHGVESKDILSPVALYDQWVHQYKHREPVRSMKRTGND